VPSAPEESAREVKVRQQRASSPDEFPR